MNQSTVFPDRPVAGVDYPADLAQLRSWFPDDAACREYLAWLRWPDGAQCPRCVSSEVRIEAGGRFRCHECWYRFSVTAGTIFDKTRTPLSVWFEVVWLVTAGKTGISAAHLHRVLQISSYQTAWTMLAKLRQVMASSESDLLTGRVEVDESFFGGHRPGVRGRGALGKTLVIGAIEVYGRKWGRARLAPIPDATTVTLKAFITKNIAPGSIVVTDSLSSYPGALAGYTHEQFNVKASGQPAHELLPGVHRIFALAKRMVEGTYQGSAGAAHLSEYLNEFVFRFNRRKSKARGLVFMRLLQKATSGNPVTYRELVRESKPKSTRPPGVTGKRSQPGTLATGTVVRPWLSRNKSTDA